MNHTRFFATAATRARRATASVAAMAALVLWMAGCSDPRTEPLQSPDPGHTETIVLWENVPSNGETIHATFTVKEDLAPISDPTEDTPARLLIVAYIRPDCQILRREQIVNSGIPEIRDSVILPTLISLDALRGTIDSMGSVRLDSIERIQNAYVQQGWAFQNDTLVYPNFQGMPCDTPLYGWSFGGSTLSDTAWAARDSMLNLLPADARTLEDRLVQARIDTLVIGYERDDLARIVDNRYTLTLWLDNDTTATIPEAYYIAGSALAGQEIFLAATDSTTGYKARAFRIDLNQFEVADPANPGFTREVNWTTCFPGSTRPCLSPGNHTLHARVTGTDSRITGTLVLVYERSTP